MTSSKFDIRQQNCCFQNIINVQECLSNLNHWHPNIQIFEKIKLNTKKKYLEKEKSKNKAHYLM